jgi:ABC-type multidrug transport system fused ATPase/permease subunit
VTSLLNDRSRMLLTYLRPQRLQVAALAALLVSSIGLQLVNPQILKSFIDSARGGATDRALALTAGLFLAVALAQQLLAVAATYLSENVGWTATNALRAELLLHCLRLDQSFHKTYTPGELIERIDGDVTALATFFSQLVIQVLGNLLLLAGVLAILWAADWRVGLLFTVLAGVVLLALNRLQTVALPLWKVARQRSAELYGFVEERLAATEDIRSSGAQPYTMRRLAAHLTDNLRAQRAAMLTGRLTWTTSDVLFSVGTAVCYLLAARLYGDGDLTIGTVYSIFFYAGLLMRPLMQISRQAEAFQKASAGIARVQELLGRGSALGDAGSGVLPPGPLSVAFEGVRFAYEADGEPVISRLSFALAPGKVLGVLGRTGSGKTTLTRLLFRLYDPQAGAITLAGADIRALTLAELRRRVGIVTQEVQLFHGTLRDNLTLFDPAIADERLLAAIEELGLDPWYRSLPSGLDSPVAGGSGGLSAGEAQLLAFTRIFLRDPGLVILDEASSRLDPATEQLIERAVDRLLVGRTGIIIAHRLHTLHHADEILILEGGAAVEYGPRELLARDPDSHLAALLRAGLEDALA